MDRKISRIRVNEIEASNLPDNKFKTMVTKMLKELHENFKKEITSIKKDKKKHEKEPDRNKKHNK